ncbi:unnamed protein product [Protopolystoma xenopodis]|uniref:Uncharacterized protein n=1 Tax=Protopolystoma xenopodis TaxID=117903 RepID=A0A3S5BWW0_9PLAT|nr:unnamed protein product [Protopolystoma xenopodis]
MLECAVLSQLTDVFWHHTSVKCHSNSSTLLLDSAHSTVLRFELEASANEPRRSVDCNTIGRRRMTLFWRQI